jgi:hypothetical protein
VIFDLWEGIAREQDFGCGAEDEKADRTVQTVEYFGADANLRAFGSHEKRRGRILDRHATRIIAVKSVANVEIDFRQREGSRHEPEFRDSEKGVGASRIVRIGQGIDLSADKSV